MVHTEKNGNALKIFLTSVADVILPRTCASCTSILRTEEKCICKTCLNKLIRADDTLLLHEYSRKFLPKNIISGFTSLYIFEKDKELQNIIHAIKYRNRYLTGYYLGKCAGEILAPVINNWQINLVLPVPLHKLKVAERGYNQSYYIAKGLSNALNFPFSHRIIKRKKYTATQTLMTLPEREKNIAGAFSIKGKDKTEGKTILLVDDVITTGATINECGRILKLNGAVKIFAISLGIAE